jgi:RNA polymerase sigma-70 factor (ECF subfamily)
MAMREPVEPSDEELLRQMMAGDSAAFAELYDRRQPSIYRFALRMSGSPSIAHDVAQDVFIALMRDGNQFDPARGSVAAYLFGMTRHRVLRTLTRERRVVSLSSGNGGNGNDPDADELDRSTLDRLLVDPEEPLDHLLHGETVDAVRQAVYALPVHYREVVVLCNLHEYSYEQTAEIIGCPVGTVRSRLNRARAMLADRLRLYQSSSTARLEL